MKLFSFTSRQHSGIGLCVQSNYYDLQRLRPTLPTSMLELCMQGEAAWQALVELNQFIIDHPKDEGVSASRIDLDAGYTLLAPLPNPSSVRDAYAFRQHVETSRRNRGLEMIPTFDEIPVFYFSNHRAVTGPGSIACMPLHLNQLDFELEVAVVIKKKGRNISPEEADEYIAGFMIMNDWSARALQMQEMQLNLGPAKGKDFSTSFGPYLVTPDELAEYQVPPPEGHVGTCYRLEMKAVVNGEEVSKGWLNEMHWTFAEIISRASYGVDLYPGDVIGSGTVGTGCFLELNGTGKFLNPEGFVEQWLLPGDQISLSVTGLGELKNEIIVAES